MDILDILLDILLKPPQPFIGLFLSLSSETGFRQKPPPIALSAVAEINIHVCYLVARM